MWLYKNIRGFKDLPEVENYATHMIRSNYLKPVSTYLQTGGHNLSQEDFSRRESYIVNTRPTTPGKKSSKLASMMKLENRREFHFIYHLKVLNQIGMMIL